MIEALKKIKMFYLNGVDYDLKKISKQENIHHGKFSHFAKQLVGFIDAMESRKSRRWSSKEKNFVHGYVRYLDQSGQRVWGNKKEVFIHLSELLGRTVSSIQQQYYKSAKEEKIKEEERKENRYRQLEEENKQLKTEKQMLSEQLMEINSSLQKAFA